MDWYGHWRAARPKPERRPNACRISANVLSRIAIHRQPRLRVHSCRDRWKCHLGAAGEPPAPVDLRPDTNAERRSRAICPHNAPRKRFDARCGTDHSATQRADSHRCGTCPKTCAGPCNPTSGPCTQTCSRPASGCDRRQAKACPRCSRSTQCRGTPNTRAQTSRRACPDQDGRSRADTTPTCLPRCVTDQFALYQLGCSRPCALWPSDRGPQHVDASDARREPRTGAHHVYNCRLAPCRTGRGCDQPANARCAKPCL